MLFVILTKFIFVFSSIILFISYFFQSCINGSCPCFEQSKNSEPFFSLAYSKLINIIGATVNLHFTIGTKLFSFEKMNENLEIITNEIAIPNLSQNSSEERKWMEIIFVFWNKLKNNHFHIGYFRSVKPQLAFKLCHGGANPPYKGLA